MGIESCIQCPRYMGDFSTDKMACGTGLQSNHKMQAASSPCCPWHAALPPSDPAALRAAALLPSC